MKGKRILSKMKYKIKEWKKECVFQNYQHGAKLVNLNLQQKHSKFKKSKHLKNHKLLREVDFSIISKHVNMGN